MLDTTVTISNVYINTVIWFSVSHFVNEEAEAQQVYTDEKWQIGIHILGLSNWILTPGFSIFSVEFLFPEIDTKMPTSQDPMHVPGYIHSKLCKALI